MLTKIGNFISETKQELNKVTWPSRNELWQATLVVIVTTFIVALFIGVADFILSMIMRIVLR
ncbi:MAG: preprotein translocase subunit SecE [Candidatus Omnitrophica bacterium]|nr:preprotein translocase subunit SecE [Candidatus Omnitrophota bacterium]